jgi:hypothetical protein
VSRGRVGTRNQTRARGPLCPSHCPASPHDGEGDSRDTIRPCPADIEATSSRRAGASAGSAIASSR